MSEALLGTASAANAIDRVKYSHDAMIDYIICHPIASQNEVAKHFGYTPAWVSRIFCSDAFQARLALRKTDMVDPIVGQSINERFNGLVMQSMDILEEKLEKTRNPDLALKVFELSTKAAGYGARQDKVAVQNNFVVHLPNKIQNPQDWASAHRPGGTDTLIIEAETR